MRPKKPMISILCCGLILFCACSYRPSASKNAVANGANPFTLTVNVKGLVALTTTNTGQIIALFPRTTDWNLHLNQCQKHLSVNNDPTHMAALRINAGYLSPDGVVGNNDDFVVIPLRVSDANGDIHEDVMIQRKCASATPVFPAPTSLAMIKDFAPTLSSLCDHCTDTNPSTVDHTKLVGRYTFDNGTLSVGDEIKDTQKPPQPISWYFDNQAKIKSLMQTVTAVETNCDPATPAALTLTDGTNPRSIPLYPKNGALEVNIVNWMPMDVLSPDPMSQNSSNEIPNFQLFYLLSKDLTSGTTQSECPFPQTNGGTVSGKPYCPLAVF